MAASGIAERSSSQLTTRVICRPEVVPVLGPGIPSSAVISRNPECTSCTFLRKAASNLNTIIRLTPTHGDTQQSVDEEIAKLEAALQECKERRNRLAPVSRLPDEVLSAIFLFVSSGAIKVLRNGKYSMKWVAFSQVARHWRMVALDSPTVWQLIRLDYSSACVHELLRRSGDASLTVLANASTQWQTLDSPKVKLLSTVLTHIHRIQRMQLVDIKFSILRALFKDLPVAERLNDLFIRAPLSPNSDFALHADMLANNQRLRNLTLNGCWLDRWDANVLSGLTSLTLWNVHDRFLSTDQALDMLQGMSALEYLDMYHALLLSPTQPLNRVVSLPQLKRLSLTARIPKITNLLDRIALPTTTAISLESDHTLPGNSFISTLRLSLTKFFATPSPANEERKPFTHLIVSCKGDRRLILKLSDSYVDDTLEQDQPSNVFPVFQLDLDFGTAAKVEEAIFNLRDVFPLQNVKNLECSALTLQTSTWVRAYGRMPNVRWIHASGETGPGIAHALVPRINPKATSQTSPESHEVMVPFPGLRSVTFFGVSFAEDLTVKLLIDYLQRRKRRGSTLEKLHLTCCYYLEEKGVKRLEKHVAVAWDGFSGNSSDLLMTEDGSDF
ncbi:hypothetical protein NLJ89_g9699 [Agrocybe chaxingu]|uniref:F-box domain-containing protein n=1 Tax=Agrocybe chaxingu TaxID=84603 RepID=A0A9W8MPL6_9AGAR|nr:hypothetical protein NLJ89_g9699 [Agrocybe chaxingu]